MAILGLNPFATEPRDGRGLLSLGTCAPVRNRKPPKSRVRGWAVYSHDKLALGLKGKILNIDEIKKVQEVLKDLGFYSGPVNGLFDTALQLAHAAYRKSFFQWVSTGPVTEFAEEMTCLAEAEAKAGVREEGGDNRGKKVEEYQRVIGSHIVGQSWCAAFVCWCMERAARTRDDFLFDLPKQGMAFRFEDWAVDQRASGVYLMDPKRISIRRGDIVIFNFSHIGICTKASEKGSFHTVEGNTTAAASSLDKEREGGGVFSRVRSENLVRSVVRLGDVLTDKAFDSRHAWG